MKSAGLELNGLRAYYKFINEKEKRDLHVPLMILIDYKYACAPSLRTQSLALAAANVTCHLNAQGLSPHCHLCAAIGQGTLPSFKKTRRGRW